MRNISITRTVLLIVVPLCAAFATPDGHHQAVRQVSPTSRAAGAAIRGRVVTAGPNAAPLRRVLIRCVGDALDRPRITLTDSTGRFEILGLTAGRYLLSAARTGFAPAQFGAATFNARPLPIDLDNSEVFDRADFVLLRGGVIAGHIADEYGEPVIDAVVTAGRIRLVSGRRTFVPVASSTTDDEGAYRVWALPPGTYVVLVRPSRYDVTTTRGLQVSTTAFFPGVSSFAQARPIVVAVGEEIEGIDFAASPVTLARLSGVIADSTGAPLRGARGALIRDDMETGRRTMVAAFVASATGAFTAERLVPGDYEVLVTGRREDSAEVAVTRVSITCGDVSDMQIMTTRASRVAGRVSVEGGALRAAPTQLRVMATAVDGDEPDMSLAAVPGQAIAGTLHPDWSFDLPVAPGQRTIRLAGLPPGWQLKAVLIRNRDVTGTPVEIVAGTDVEGIQMTVTDRLGQISGQVIDDRSVPLPGASVVIFARDHARRLAGGVFVYTERTNQLGRFRVAGIAPGDYMVAAAADIDPDNLTSPEQFERLETGAMQLSVTADTNARVTLTVSRTM